MGEKGNAVEQVKDLGGQMGSAASGVGVAAGGATDSPSKAVTNVATSVARSRIQKTIEGNPDVGGSPQDARDVEGPPVEGS
jgi:hypothetical protein